MDRVKLRNAVVVAICLFFGGLAGFFLRGIWADLIRTESVAVEQREGGARFINPLLTCDTPRDVIQNRELLPFQREVEEEIRKRISSGMAKSISVYFRELNDGLWFSTGDPEKFTIASLRKVPMLIAFLKQAESDRGILLRKIRFQLQRDYNAAQAIKPSSVMTDGQDYTVQELLYRMIVYSDNNAFALLSAAVDTTELDRVYQVFSVKPPKSDAPPDYQSVVTYASFLRILFNASYLNREMSEKALELLSLSEFRTGIVSGVPADIPVAHKFGEHWAPGEPLRELHDCGIVYYPEHPYLLCIMTRGERLESLDDAIAAVSGIVFKNVARQNLLPAK